ncbi:MAG: hypothetical protein ACLQUY_19045 [Ktedonobacterales bacterium]
MSAKCHIAPTGSLPKILILLSLMLLAACGQTTSTTGINNGGPVEGKSPGTPTVTAAPTVAGTGTPAVPGTSSATTGCPLATQAVQWPSPPTVIVTSATASKGATVQVGQTVEIALAFGHRWSLMPAAGQPELVLNTPAGYGDASLKSCVWRFTAQDVGQTTLKFTFAAICQPHQACPQFVGLLNIPINVLES